MIENITQEANLGHMINISEKKNITITGIKRIDSFDEEEFLLETIMGYMIIKGSNLEIIKLDTYQGNVSIKGNIISTTYVNDTGKTESSKDESIFGKLFK